MRHPYIAKIDTSCAAADIDHARAMLASAAALVRLAQSLAGPMRRAALASVRRSIAEARALYADAVATLAACGGLAHRYARDAGGWRAVVRADDVTVWTGPRTYGRRQSAQRAALVWVRGVTV